MCLDGTWSLLISLYFTWPGLRSSNFLAYHTEHCNSWPMRSWRKATVNILEHQSTRSWWILSARVCIVDCIRVKAHKFNRVSKQETLDLNPWHTKHVKCFYSDHVNSLGWMIVVLSFTGTKLFSQLPSPPRRIDKNQPFAPPQDWLTSNFSLQYHLWITHGGHENRGNIQPPKKFLTV